MYAVRNADGWWPPAALVPGLGYSFRDARTAVLNEYINTLLIGADHLVHVWRSPEESSLFEASAGPWMSSEAGSGVWAHAGAQSTSGLAETASSLLWATLHSGEPTLAVWSPQDDDGGSFEGPAEHYETQDTGRIATQDLQLTTLAIAATYNDDCDQDSKHGLYAGPRRCPLFDSTNGLSWKISSHEAGILPNGGGKVLLTASYGISDVAGQFEARMELMPGGGHMTIFDVDGGEYSRELGNIPGWGAQVLVEPKMNVLTWSATPIPLAPMRPDS